MNLEGNVVQVPLVEIIPNRFQPRLSFDEQGLKELADSIKIHGVIQPLVLRRVGDKYEIIAGERRYKASTMAGLITVPAVISNIDDNTSAEVALVENIQRRDLTAIEEARSYKNLLDKGYLTQEQLATKMGLSQSAISNKLRLLNLADEVQEALLNEKISERHARTLLMLNNLDDQKKWLDRILVERLTVRQLDTELKKLKLNREEETIPLVDITPNIDAIKNNAMDINPVDTPKIMPDFLGAKPEININPVDTYPQEVKPEENQRRFFNFLEYEAANLDVNEEDSSSGGSIMEPIRPINEQMITQPITDQISAQNEASLIIPPAPSPIDLSPVSDPFMNSSVSNIISPVEIPNETISTETLTPNVGSMTETLAFDTLEMPSLTPSPSSFEPVETLSQITPDIQSVENSVSVVSQILSEIPLASQTPTIEDAPTQNIIEQPTPLTPDIQSTENSVSPASQILSETSLSSQTPIIEDAPTQNIIEQSMPSREYVDPVASIATLDPSYQDKLKEEAGLDLKSAINRLRTVAKELDNQGFILDLEEIDFDSYYQFNIKIQK